MITKFLKQKTNYRLILQTKSGRTIDSFEVLIDATLTVSLEPETVFSTVPMREYKNDKFLFITAP